MRGRQEGTAVESIKCREDGRSLGRSVDIWLLLSVTSCWQRGAASSVAGGQDPVLRRLGVMGKLVSGYSLPPRAPPTLSRIMDQMTACVRKVSSCKLQKKQSRLLTNVSRKKNCFFCKYTCNREFLPYQAVRHCAYVGHHTLWLIQISISVSKPEYLRPYRLIPTDWQKSYIVTALVRNAQ